MNEGLIPRAATILVIAVLGLGAAYAETTKYVRYDHQGETAYGILEGDSIRELEGNFLETTEPTGKTIPLSDAKLLAPVEPRKVIAVGLNFQSHLGSAKPSETPPIFLKLPTCIVGPGESIVIPNGARAVSV